MAAAADAQGLIVRFLNPLWILGLVALALPVALHLYGRRPGRVVRLGTLRDIPSTPIARTFAFRIEDRWRLLFRCAVLALAVMALAGPLLGSRRTAGEYVIASPAALASASGQRLADSLRGSGADLLTLGAHEDAWSGMLRAADLTRGRLHAVGPGVIGELGTVRPALENPVRWHRVAPMAAAPGAMRRRPAVVLREPLPDDTRRRLDAARAAVAAEAGLKVSELELVYDTTPGVVKPVGPTVLTRADLAKPELPFRLAAVWLAAEREHAWNRLPAPTSMLLPSPGVQAAAHQRRQPATRWLLGLAALLLLAERTLSHRLRIKADV